ncbi:MAG TPA: FtsX-like permease family protein [Rhodothermales bacterium]|nr:ABC transporter permease [Bacteroidota bacterium]HRK74318.1 FtsX-like permease family protein [Rhodothermales bacterium]HRR10340.1 FtsX-like permease family protein [Rhodothermales bacterium]
MKLAFQMAYKNLIGAGLRTWLNVGVLAFAFWVILFYNGLLDGWNQQARRASIAWEYGAGQAWHKDYDPLDPFTIQDGHGIWKEAPSDAVPVLIRSAVLYPQGRMIPVSLAGIVQSQKILALPTATFLKNQTEIPAIIGRRMAENAKLRAGDQVLLRWRDQYGTFDAANITITGVFKTDVPTVDQGKIWIPIEQLWKMTGLKDHATYYVLQHAESPKTATEWKYMAQEKLLADLDEIIKSKKAGSAIMYLLLLAIALLALFDTQVLSVFRRQREIGTYIALGMTRWQVVGLFTVEGSMYSLFAMVVGGVLGFPIFVFLAKQGIAFPASSQDFGIAMADRVFPVFGPSLIAFTIALIVISATIVSFLPVRRIARMNPVDALKGKIA